MPVGVPVGGPTEGRPLRLQSRPAGARQRVAPRPRPADEAQGRPHGSPKRMAPRWLHSGSGTSEGSARSHGRRALRRRAEVQSLDKHIVDSNAIVMDVWLKRQKGPSPPLICGRSGSRMVAEPWR